VAKSGHGRVAGEKGREYRGEMARRVESGVKPEEED